MIKVLFICSGNTCRSPMAEYIGNKLAKERNVNMEFQSAGLHAMFGDGASENSIKALNHMGVDLRTHRSRRINPEMIMDFDYIIPMTKSLKLELNIYFPNLEDKIKYVGEFTQKGDISDPYGKNFDNYMETRDEIYFAVEKIIEKLGG